MKQKRKSQKNKKQYWLFWALIIVLIWFIGCKKGSKPPMEVINQINKLYIASWYVNYSGSKGMASYQNNSHLLDEINPVWYAVEGYAASEVGAPSLVRDDAPKAEIMKVAVAKGIKVLPTIQNYDYDLGSFSRDAISRILADPVKRTHHVGDIVDLVVTENYEGIDIDYENLTYEDRPHFSTFIQELGEALAVRGKLLSVAVYAKTHDRATWSGPGAQDWEALLPYVDSLKIMAYDYHWATCGHAGPIAPTDWLRDILNYCRKIPGSSGKIIIGLPLYGFDWCENQRRARGLFYDDILWLLNNKKISNLSRSSIPHTASHCATYYQNAEVHFEYLEDGQKHIVYYQDALTQQERLLIIKDYPDVVKGITFWRLGGEDPEVWSLLSDYKKK